MSDQKPHPKMTEQQAHYWACVLAEAEAHVGYPVDTSPYYWFMEWAEEVRPGRGHDLNAMWVDADYYIQVLMNVYGHYSIVVAGLNVIHNSSDEECPCLECEKERDDE